MRPNSVAMPVATATPRARPLRTDVPIQAIDVRSLSDAVAATPSVPFRTALDSPVSADSSTRSSRTPSRRRSAGTRSPASSNTRSPATTPGVSIVCSRPSRSTRQRGVSSRRSASIARSARHSCANPSNPFSNRIAPIAAASSSCPTSSETAAATARMAMNRSAN